MALEPGTRLGPYEVTGAIGAGGMGEVYRATDTKLRRDVAIKVLPEDFAQDADRLARFEREAHLLASLNHPNIASIYGLEESDDQRCLVLELVEGETLAERIAAAALPVEDALEIARQIAAALEAAHEKGIVHRDLKPANVKITADDTVKVLDFGLAKALHIDPPAGQASGVSLSPTVTLGGTREGVILGTAPYMSPEQAKGKQADNRADVWALGCVIYQMLTGHAAFGGGDVTETLAAVLRDQPDWSKLPESLHPRAREVMERCLEKDPRNRYHHVADVRIDLERIIRSPEKANSPDAPQRQPLGVATWVVAFTLGVLLAGVTIWNLRPPAPTTSRPVRFSFEVPTPPGQSRLRLVSGGLAMSPDGSTVAYVGARPAAEQGHGVKVRQLYLRRIDEPEGRAVPGSEGAKSPFFSPDGAWVGFVAGSKLQRVPIAGGAPLEICNAWEIFGVSWGPDDRIIFGGGISSGLMAVSASGGQPEPLTSPDPAAGEINHGYPEILPGGKTILYTVGTGSGSRIARLSLDTRSSVTLLPDGAKPRYLSAGYLMFSENDNLRLVPFDAQEGRVTGSVLPALDGVQWNSVAGLEQAEFAVSRSGDLAYVPGSLVYFDTSPVWVDRRGERTPIEADGAFYIGPRISPDGRRIAMIRLGELGVGEVWIMDEHGGQAFPAADDGADYNPVWSNDGTKISYTSNGDIFERSVDKDDVPLRVLRRDNYQLPRSWSPDGRNLAFTEWSPDGSRIWVMPRDGEPEPLLGLSFNSGAPRFAPQGGWISYVSEESGRAEVYVRRYPGTDRGYRISREGGWEPVWSVDGRELFYRRGNQMMAVQITTDPELEVGEPVELWSALYFSQQPWYTTNYDVGPDGRFLMLAVPDTPGTPPLRVHVLLDWFTEVETSN